MKQNKNKDKKLNVIDFIKNNAIALIWLLVFFAALFNFGYFLLLDIKYLGLLGISDYYAGTMLYLGFMFIFVGGVLCFFLGENYLVMIYSNFIQITNILYKICKLSIKEFNFNKRANKAAKLLESDKFIIYKKEKRQLNKMLEQDKKIKKELGELKKQATSDFGALLLIIICVIVVVGLIGFNIYNAFGKHSLKILSIIFALFLGIDYLFVSIDCLKSRKEVRLILRIAGLIVLTLFLGVCMLLHDLKNSNIKVCSDNNCYYVLRKIDAGYFAVDNCNLVFLTNDLQVQTVQVLQKRLLLESCDKKSDSNNSV